jgi:hypothetical protein
MRVILLLFALFFAPHTALGQTDEGLVPGDPISHQQVDSESNYQQTSPEAQAGAGKSTASERSSARADVAKRRPFQESPIERALKGVNPCNVPYGGLLAEWHLAAVQETIENFYYWALLTLIVIVMLQSSYILWLQRQREERLQIAGGIVAQLWNAHVFAQQKALEAIEAHNRLVAELDAKDEAGEERSVRAAETSSTIPESSRTAGAEGDRSPEAQPSRGNEVLKKQKFERAPTLLSASSSESDQDGKESDAAPLSVKAIHYAMSKSEKPSEILSTSEEPTGAGLSSDAFRDPQRASDETGGEDMEALKLALQKVQAQLATKDVQLRAKDDKIASQRQLISDMNNRPRTSGNGGSGAN